MHALLAAVLHSQPVNAEAPFLRGKAAYDARVAGIDMEVTMETIDELLSFGFLGTAAQRKIVTTRRAGLGAALDTPAEEAAGAEEPAAGAGGAAGEGKGKGKGAKNKGKGKGKLFEEAVPAAAGAAGAAGGGTPSAAKASFFYTYIYMFFLGGI